MRQGMKKEKWWIVFVVIGLLITLEITQFQRDIIHTYDTKTFDRFPRKVNIGNCLEEDDTSCEREYTAEELLLVNSNSYLEVYPFAESQGWCARVQMVDGSFAVIDRHEQVLVDGLDYINPLPCVTDRMSAKRDGHVVLFEFSHENEKIQELKEYFDFSEISEIYYGEFGLVKSYDDGLYGVISWNGDVIIPAKHVEITWSRSPLVENPYVSKTTFKLLNADGKYDKYVWIP